MRPWLRGTAHAAFFSWHRPATGLRAIFIYHSVGRMSALSEPEATFRRQVTYLTRWFRVVRLSEFLSAAAADHRNLACITFDDGYVDNATVARGILEAAGVPGTFFVVAGLLGRDFHTSAGPFRLMTPSQVTALAAAGHEVGAHSISHPKLPDIPAAEARREVADSKRVLEDLLGTPVTSFSYPKARMNAEVRGFVEEAGFRQAVIVHRRLVTPPIDPLALPRVTPRDYIRLMMRAARR